MAIFEILNQRIIIESESGTKSVCCILVSHLLTVHTHAMVLKYLKFNSKGLDLTALVQLSKE